LMRGDYPNLQYCYFVEVTKQLYVHFHIYLEKYVNIHKVSENWQIITGSWITKIKLVESEDQIRYCSDYHNVSKKFKQYQLEFAFKHISRFFGQSRNFFNKKEEIESLFIWLGRIGYKGLNLLEFMDLKDINKSQLLNIEKINQIVDTICFRVELEPKPNSFMLHGIDKTYKPPKINKLRHKSEPKFQEIKIQFN